MEEWLSDRRPIWEERLDRLGKVPNGEYFVFKSERGDTSQIWALQERPVWWRRANPDPIRLTSGPVNYYQPTPSRDGKSIFAIGVQPLGELLRYGPTRKDFVPFLGDRSIAHLSYSSDGKWSAYVAYPEGYIVAGPQ